MQVVLLLLILGPGALGQVQTGFKRTVADISGIKQGCVTTGYEKRTRELCEEVTDRVCTVRVQSEYELDICEFKRKEVINLKRPKQRVATVQNATHGAIVDSFTGHLVGRFMHCYGTCSVV
jgi:hypothetical protein